MEGYAALGQAVAAIAGDSRLAADGTWTLTSVVEEGTNGKKLPSLKIKRGESKIIGRAKGPGVDLVVPLPCVSTVHCELETEGNKLYITDLGSTNGTFASNGLVSAAKLKKKKNHALKVDHLITFGSCTFKWTYFEGAQALADSLAKAK